MNTANGTNFESSSLSMLLDASNGHRNVESTFQKYQIYAEPFSATENKLKRFECHRFIYKFFSRI